MQLLRAIDAQPNQELVLAQKRVPLVIQQRAVGLQVVLDVQTRTLVFLFQRDHLLEELDTQQRRLAALPREHDFVAALSFDVLANVGFENLVADAELAVAAQQFFLVQVIAIGAVEVADRPDRLHHGVKARRRSRVDRQR